MGDDSSDEGPATVAFSQSKREAMESLKQAADDAKLAKESRKRKQRKHLEKMKTQRETKLRTLRVEKLPDEVVDSLTTVPSRTRKKLSEKQKPRTVLGEDQPKTKKKIKRLSVDDCSVPNTESCTTRFQVMDLKKFKAEKRSEARLTSFRQKMLGRNPRQPVSSYLTCLRKREASGKEKFIS